MAEPVVITAVTGIGEIVEGDDLAAILAEALGALGIAGRDGDVLVVAQKIVSKAEGRSVRLGDVRASARALALAETTGKDPRVVELALAESTEVVRAVAGVLITRHRLGFVLANAGIDRSNVPAAPDEERALLLPLDPDRSAWLLSQALSARLGARTAVIVSDSFGRPWRSGVVNVGIGAAGVTTLWDRRGEVDRSGRTLVATEVAHVDALAAAAGLVMGEGAEGLPAAHIRGVSEPPAPVGAAADLIRPLTQDLFR